MQGLTARLRADLSDAIPNLQLFGHSEHRIPGNLNVGVSGVVADRLVNAVTAEVAVPTGSACSTGALEPSRVLLALGFGLERAATGVHISLARFTTRVTSTLRAPYCTMRGEPWRHDGGIGNMTKRKKPALQFGPTTTPQGFTLHSMSSFNDLQPARIVRELIQNSLDAAVEAREPTAIVRFRVTTIRRERVPDIDHYETAFRAAVRDQKRLNGELSDPAQQVVDTIDRALQDLSESECWCLSVIDNGIGLDAKRMNALLGDGASLKPSDAAGSYGVGHFASIPASDLRYVLYGGVVESGRRVASGCAVLASRIRASERYPCAAQGYLVDAFKGGEYGTYDFIGESSIPGLIAASLHPLRDQRRRGCPLTILVGEPRR